MRKLLAHPLTQRARRIVKAVVVSIAVLIAVFLVTSITVDLGPVLRTQAERGASYYMKGRPVHIGKLSVRLARGHYVLEDFVVDGFTPESRPWLRAKKIEISMPWGTLFDRRFVLDAINMTDWDMYVELAKDGRTNFPSFRTSAPSNNPKRWTTTLQYIHAYRGKFTYDDRGTPWQVITPNLDVTVAKPSADYRGSAKFSNGSVAFQQYKPFRIDMASTFKIENGLVKFDKLDLNSEGAQSKLTGVVDMGHWPEQTYQMRSKIDFPTQKAIWFAKDTFTVTGEGDFVGTFHMFKEQMPGGRTRTGRELKGVLTATTDTTVNRYRFGNLRAPVLWIPEKLEVAKATATVYGGTSTFDFLMAMGQNGARTQNTFDARYQDVDLTAISDLFNLDGIRFAGKVGGHHLVSWPIGRWAELRGGGEAHLVAPADARLMTRDLPLAQIERRYEVGKPFGPFSNHLPWEPVPIGGDLAYTYDPEWIDVAPSHIATPDTFIDIEGRTAYLERSRMPFHVSSADWQESDRMFAGVLTAFGSRTKAIQVGGYGTFDGLMLGSFRAPRIEGMFAGERMNAFDTEWGSITGNAVIENSYADVKDIVVRSGDSTINVEGKFSLGYPRKDGGEEINARIRIDKRPIVDLRHAFELDDYRLDGTLSGTFSVYGNYETPLGVGTMTIADGVAYDEPFETASAKLTLVGTGVNLSEIDIVKSAGASGTGRARGNAFVGWNGTYNFSIDGSGVPVESLAAAKSSPLPLSGLIDFTAGGSGTFEMPRYDVHGTIRDLFVKDEGVGQIKGDLTIVGDLLTLNIDAASPQRLSVHGSGSVVLNDQMDTNFTFVVNDTSLDPYLRAYDPRLSPYTTLVATGTVTVRGELADPDNLLVDATIDKVDARLFDYQLQNACPNGGTACTERVPILAAFDRNTLRVKQMRLAGDGTALDISGNVDVRAGTMKMGATGDANLAVLQAFDQNIRSSGTVALQAALEGRTDDPTVSGRLTVENGRIRHLSLRNSLENIQGTASFDTRGITLDGLTARFGDGPVQFFGRIDKEGYLPGRFDIQITGQGNTVRFPEGMRSKIDPNLLLQGTLQGAVLSGQVYVREAVYTKDFDTDILALATSSGSTTPVVIGGGPSLQETLPLRYDVDVTTALQGLRVENNLLRVAATAELQLRGTYDRPSLLGNTTINRGELSLLGRRYLVTQGTIDFNNPGKIEPFFDVEVQTRVRVPQDVYVVTLRLAGTPSRVAEPELAADPPLPTAEIISLLFSDVTPNRDYELRRYSTTNSTQQQLVRDLATLAITESATSRVNRAFQQTFGVDQFQVTPTLVDPNAESARLDPSARVIIGERLTDKAYLTYSRSLSSSTRDQIIQLEYDQNDRLSLVFSRNEDRTYAIEVRVRTTY